MTDRFCAVRIRAAQGQSWSVVTRIYLAATEVRVGQRWPIGGVDEPHHRMAHPGRLRPTASPTEITSARGRTRAA